MWILFYILNFEYKKYLEYILGFKIFYLKEIYVELILFSKNIFLKCIILYLFLFYLDCRLVVFYNKRVFVFKITLKIFFLFVCYILVL